MLSPGAYPTHALLKVCRVEIISHLGTEPTPLISLYRLPEKGIFVKTSTNNLRFFMVSPLPTAVFFAPPDIWCQIVARLPISPMMEFTISVASIVRVREEI